MEMKQCKLTRRWIVYDDNGHIVIITSHKKIANNLFEKGKNVSANN